MWGCANRSVVTCAVHHRAVACSIDPFSSNVDIDPKVAGFSGPTKIAALDGDGHDAAFDAGFDTGFLQRVLSAEAASAATEGKPGSAGQREGVDAILDTPRLLGVAHPE
jgi:hypothetical protein